MVLPKENYYENEKKEDWQLTHRLSDGQALMGTTKQTNRNETHSSKDAPPQYSLVTKPFFPYKKNVYCSYERIFAPRAARTTSRNTYQSLSILVDN